MEVEKKTIQKKKKQQKIWTKKTDGFSESDKSMRQKPVGSSPYPAT